ncbi:MULTISPECIES: hypothetical protein [unclassified Microcoleus]|uniref:hypothetical protein n=1 Tax=unclassified Microcoleus TaxID=2642155 RepID=UPI001D93AB68|nr:MULTISPECIES: hypothetical protein [unclassified Microcoleus]MCC3595787.1 hypothetical protein [Microcoleus sp. PH2017_26_ELK_O_A]MCC3620588.1 hypothetical protein [Microcoleus sp. PH2017_36_ELK_O_B]
MLNQIDRSKIAEIVLKAVTFVKSKLQKLQAPTPAPTPQYGQVPLPLPKLRNTQKLILMFLVASITTALILPQIIGRIKVSNARPAIRINLPNNKTANRVFGVLVSAAVIAAITEKDWRK